jgi:hypothetical protein
LLCVKCHQKEHGVKPSRHGTIGMYNNHNCRCKKCRAANSRYQRLYRSKTR